MSGSILEILADANKNPKSIMAVAGNTYLRSLMECAYFPEKKMVLPEGDPPYKPSGMNDYQNKGGFWQVARKIDNFTREDIPTIKRESMFIHALESISNNDAKVLLAVKDQTLESLYPNLTYETLKKVGYF